MLRCLLSGPPLSRVLSGTCSRKLAYWNIEWKPAPYPCTPAQREAAAKRYGILLTDYQPFENDGYAPGDYPNMKAFNEANRDPWEHYDYYPVKRNYNEPVPFYWEFYSEAGADPDFQEVHHYGQPMWWVSFKFILPLILVGGFTLLLEPYSFFQPEKAKQFPFCKKDEHYTFEPEI
ncbi:hypothetical protein CRM22_000069 [Opisthorchis felineus]|uniref:NADH dehydrogenase [ubiquinone] 1 beta subcomplex subunit 8, mitochondrial n=1 Tax=Opisthorchis felineus TaxID=147828 RepID=A0A4S2MGZ9_OPIFE|nr:hypothetical protein CRM22_000069 [Opisthorchis felineus]